jgi:hypothetical protein
MGGFAWQQSPEQVFGPAIDAYLAAVRVGVEAIAMRWAPDIEAWMKENTPWTDRTGNARQNLRTEVVDLTSEIVIMLAHGMEYGIFLELAHGGKYEIIGPALDRFAPLVLADVQKMMGR